MEFFFKFVTLMNIIHFGNKPKKSKILGANFEKNVLKKNFTWGGLTPKSYPLSPILSANFVDPKVCTLRSTQFGLLSNGLGEI